MNILIVKTSSFGDILQAFFVLEYIREKYPKANIDWVVKEKASCLVKAHPLIRKAISFTNIFEYSFIQKLREEAYDIVFDLQGNIKSGIVTFFSKGTKKVGFDISSCAEWGNIFFTNRRYKIDQKKNIRLQYLDLLKSFFQDFKDVVLKKQDLNISQKEKIFLDQIFSKKEKIIFVSLHSRWENKRLKDAVLEGVLKKIEKRYKVFFLFTYNNMQEKKISEIFFQKFSKNSLLIEPLSLPMLSHLIDKVDLVISYDTCLLHLCHTTPSFSMFGPSSIKVYKPIGKQHVGVFGKCPYNKKFIKRCPSLRSCKKNRCMEFSKERLFEEFSKHFHEMFEKKS